MTQNPNNTLAVIHQKTQDGELLAVLVSQHYTITLSTHKGFTITVLRFDCLGGMNAYTVSKHKQMPTDKYFLEKVGYHAPDLADDMHNAQLDFTKELTKVYAFLTAAEAA